MTVWLDGGFWKGYFETVFIPHVNAFCDALLKRVVPAFEEIEKEAEAIADAEYERYLSMPADDEGDPASAAEEAQETALVYYLALDAVRQSLLNLGVAALWHLLEQQLLLYHRRQVLPRSEENDLDKISMKEMKKRLNEAGVAIEELPSWSKIDELRLIANSVKHAEGASSEKLRALRPVLFIHPSMRDDDSSFAIATPTLEMPLAGEDLYLTQDDVELYRQAVVSFWRQFGEAIEAVSKRDEYD